MTDSLIVLAGGASSRMKKSTSDKISDEMVQQANKRNKALILLQNRPMLDYVLYNAKRAGIKNIYIVVGKENSFFKNFYGTEESGNNFNGLRISYAIQHIPKEREKPFGTADAIYQTLEQYPDLKANQFIVCNCDNLYSLKAFKALRDNANENAFINYDRDALEYPEERINRFALTTTDENNFLQDIIEKPHKDEVHLYRDAKNKLRVSMNIFKFNGELFYPFLKSCPIHPQRNEKELPTALLNMIQKHPKSTYGIPFSEHVPDLTGKDDILSMNEYIANNKINLDW